MKNNNVTFKVLVGVKTHPAIRYCNVLRKLEITPIVSTDTALVKSCDALLLPGGADIDPILYHQENKGSKDICLEEDLLQIELYHLFFEKKKPVIGICKGMQIINVAEGGSLIQNLSTSSFHAYQNGDRYHITNALPGSVLKNRYGEHIITNSAHHQAILKPGKDLKITQYSYDNVIEGIEHLSAPVIGVQWHPERMLYQEHQLAPYADGLLLFQYFLKQITDFHLHKSESGSE